jgi:dihydropyrimidine dehydrogenase (NAD+) subunit PreA
MVAEIARDPATAGLPISGIGGVTTWRDAAEFIALGAGTVQVCTAAMVYGFKIVQDMIDGLANFMDERGHASVEAFRGKALASVTDWQHLNLAYTEKAVIDQALCIRCGRCHIACEDTSHQAITALRNGERHFEIVEAECVGCNLCTSVCPVPGCITMRALNPGEVDRRTGTAVSGERLPWTRHPNNPMRQG